MCAGARERRYRVPGATLTEREHSVPLDHARPDGPQITVFTREVAAPDGDGPPVPPLPPGRPGLRGGPPHESADGLDEACPPGLPRAAARPARNRALDARRLGDPGRLAGGAGVVPDALPRRLDRSRRRAHPRGAGRRALERARPELRRLHLDDLPVDRARGAARGLHHRRAVADRPTGRRHLRRDVPAADRPEPALLRALPGRPGAGPRDPAPARRRGGPAAVGRPADRATLPPARAVARRQRRVRAPPPRHRAAVRVAGVPARRRGAASFQPQPDLRHAPRVVVRGRRRDALVGGPAPAGRSRGGGLLHGRARLPVDVGGLRGPARATGPRPSSSPSIPGRRCTTPTQLRRNDVPVAATIYVNDLYVERDFAEETAATIRGCGPGRPTNSSTTGSAPTASGCSVG